MREKKRRREEGVVVADAIQKAKDDVSARTMALLLDALAAVIAVLGVKSLQSCMHLKAVYGMWRGRR